VKRIIAYIILSGTICCIAGDETPSSPAPEVRLSLSQAVRTVLAVHPELEALRLQAEAVGEEREQAMTPPEPMLSFGLMDMTNAGSDWTDAAEKRVTLEQKIPWYGKRELRRQIADRKYEGAGHALAAQALRLQRETKEAFHSLYAIRRTLAVTRADEQVIQRIADLAEALYATGKRSQNDFIRAEAEKTVLRQSLIELDAQEAVLGATLNVLMNRPPEHPVETLLPPPEWPALDAWSSDLREAAETRPNVLTALARSAMYGQQAELAQKEFWPDPIVSVEYRGNRSGEDMLMLMVGFDLPVWRSSLRAGVRQAKLLRQANLAEARVAAQENALRIETARIALQAAQRSLELYINELLPQADAGFQASEAGYRNGQVTFTELLEQHRILLATRLKIIATKGEIGRQTARLEEATDVIAIGENGERRP